MKNNTSIKLVILCLGVCTLLNACVDAEHETRIINDFNFDWSFGRGEIADAHSIDFDDSNWKKVRLPHDWSVEEGFSQENTASATAHLPGGIGWYRKTFTLPEDAQGKTTWIEFDGVYNNSTVWLNGEKLGTRPYGYIPFQYDLTPHLNYGEKENIIVVKADRSAYVDCRWYPGSGIYRNVKLVSVNKTHIPVWGTFISTPKVSTEEAKILIETSLRNLSDEDNDVSVLITILNPNGEKVGETLKKVNVSADELIKVTQSLMLQNPELWDTELPHLYTALTELKIGKTTIDNTSTTFGIRDIRYDSEQGFFLNGKSTLLKGVCLHHDGGLVGAAVPDGVWERRLMQLKEGGCNAIRTAHNPPSEAFLNLCDRMGFLVQDEAFDEFDNPKSKRHNFNQEKAETVTTGYTEHFREWRERDVKAMVLRDRNHPSVIMWSIGNEIEWTYPRYGQATGYWGSNKATPSLNYYWDEPPFSIEKMKEIFYSTDSGSYNLATTARKLSTWIKEIDTTHPVTANLVIPSVGHFSGYTDVLDIVGYSYREVVYDYGHKHYPEKMIVGTENFPRWHEWKYAIERPFIPGIFIWKGIGYLGEAGQWPNHGGGSGLLNLAGFQNPAYHHFKSFWQDEPTLYITTQTADKSPYTYNADKTKVVERVEGWWKRQKWGWQNVNEHWDYQDRESIAVEVYTNCSSVELFLNGESFGIDKLEDNEDRILKWIIPYSEGSITAIGTMEDGTKFETSVHSTNEPSGIQLTIDKQTLNADFYDVSHIVAQLIDAQGNPIKDEANKRRITFEIEGDCRILGIDNGSGDNIEGFNSNTVMTYRGKCVFIVQANGTAGTLKITSKSEGLKDSQTEILVKEL